MSYPSLPPGAPVPWEYTSFGYDPSISACIAICVVFGVSGAVHAFLAFKYGTRFMYAVVFGCALEVLGLGFRLQARKSVGENPFELNNSWYSTQFAFIIIAPIFFAAGVYVLLSQIVQFIGDKYSPLRRNNIALIFVGCDILAFVVQVSASIVILTTKDPDIMDHGRVGLVVGLFIQVASVFVFLGLSAVVFFRAWHLKGRWRLLMWNQVVLSCLILARNAFRVAEFWSGFFNSISQNETLMYIFDLGLMLVLVWCFAIGHPGELLTADAPGKSSQDQDSEASKILDK